MEWLEQISSKLTAFLDHQRAVSNPGYYAYSFTGDFFDSGTLSNLAGGIFALKLYRMIGEQDQKIIQPIIHRILSFQREDATFRDPYVCRKRLIRNFFSNLKHGQFLDIGNKQYVRAETRQAYSALLLYDVLPKKIILQIPTEPADVRHFLQRLDWSRPWGAGSHFSHLMFFLSLLHRTGQLPDAKFLEARAAATDFVSSLQHETDGAWYTGNPSHRQKVNGAMKVITGLVVDDLPFEYPKQLIDLCLLQPPNKTADACDQINQILVLRYSDKLCKHSYRHHDIEQFCLDTLDVWREYYYPQLGGFSFHKHRANDRYYGAKITRGFDEPDIHGTTMFVWGLGMMKHLIQIDELNFLHEIKS